MSNTSFDKTDDLTGVLTIHVPRSAYEAEFNEVLKKQQKSGKVKGFRPGKTPLATLRKMVGDQVLVDIVNKRVQAEVETFMRSGENNNLLGEPLLSERQAPVSITARSLDDYEFSFDVGMHGPIDLSALEDGHAFTRYQVLLDDDMVEEQLENFRRSNGENKEVEDIEDNDMLTLEIVELENGAPKPDGYTHELKILVSRVTETVREQLLSRQVGDSLTLDLLELEPDTDEQFVRRQFLQLDPDDERELSYQAQATIKTSSRVVPAELTEEVLAKIFGAESGITTVEQARERISEQMVTSFNEQGSLMTNPDIQAYLLEKIPIALPMTFVRRWLQLSEEEMPDGSEKFVDLQKSLRWSLLRNRIIQENQLEITADDLREVVYRQIDSYFGGMSLGAEFMDQMAQRLLQNEQERQRIVEQATSEKVMKFLQGKVTFEDELVDISTMNEKIQEFNARYADEEEE